MSSAGGLFVSLVLPMTTPNHSTRSNKANRLGCPINVLTFCSYIHTIRTREPSLPLQPKPTVHSPGKPIGCLLVTHLPAKAELRRHPEQEGRPLIICDGSEGRPRVLDRTPQAVAARIGEPLEAALARCRDAVTLWADTEHYEDVSDDLLAALSEVADRIEPGEPGTFYLDLTGVARLYGDPDNLHQALLAACDSHWRPRLGVAGGKFPARCAALQAEAGGVQCLPGDRKTVRRWLAPLPVGQLPVPLEMADRLRIFGIHTFGEVARQSAGALEAQFGPTGRRAWELARGMDREPVVPTALPVSVQEHLDFPFPSDSVTMLESGLQALSQRIWQHRELHNRGVRRAIVRGSLAEGGTWHFERTLNAPVSDGEEMLRILQSGLAARSPDGASRYPVGELENLILTLSGLSRRTVGRQHTLWDDTDKTQAHTRLTGRLAGAGRLVPLEPESRLPERRWALGEDLRPLNTPRPLAVESDGRSSLPNRVDLAGNGRWQRVAHILDLWEVETEWWHREQVRRRYCRLELDPGKSITVFRDLESGDWFRQDY